MTEQIRGGSRAAAAHEVGSAEQIVATVAGLTRWAARTSTRIARRLPGAVAVEAELAQLEQAALGELRRRLDSVDPLDAVRAATNGSFRPAGATQPLRAAMAELLTRAVEQSRRRADEHLYLAILRQLLPDEARILAALADGDAFPLVHVDHRSGMGGAQRVLANASTVGRAAGVSAPHAVPRYLTRLLNLDLVQVGEADPELADQYQACMNDAAVCAAEEDARRRGRVRVVRETITISAFGRELWAACRPREVATPPAAPVDAPQEVADLLAPAELSIPEAVPADVLDAAAPGAELEPAGAGSGT